MSGFFPPNGIFLGTDLRIHLADEHILLLVYFNLFFFFLPTPVLRISITEYSVGGIHRMKSERVTAKCRCFPVIKLIAVVVIC